MTKLETRIARLQETGETEILKFLMILQDIKKSGKLLTAKEISKLTGKTVVQVRNMLNCYGIKYKSLSTANDSTICWLCENFCGDCSLTKSYTPVKGWTALKTRLKDSDNRIVESYCVKKCPKFKPDENIKARKLLRKLYAKIDNSEEKATQIIVNKKFVDGISKICDFDEFCEMVNCEVVIDKAVKDFEVKYD